MNMFYKQTSEEAMRTLGVSDKGLNDLEIKKRREKQGFNELTEGARKSNLQVFLEQFKDFLVVILLGAALISAFLGKFESTLVIIVVVVINAILGTVQHVKAEQSLKSLKALSSPTAKVLRNGQKLEIPSRELLIGDILYLDAGDYVSADGRIIENYSLQINESSLTGESESVLKTTDIINEDNVAIGDKKNMVFSGSFVTYGRALILVTSIGMETELGKIANLLETAKEKKTPLQVNLDNFGKKLAFVILAISALIFALNVFRGYAIIDSFMFAVSLAVAAIPEALSSIVTIVLAIGTQKMSRENAVVRKLHAVESLGSISVICSDKTGTLTQNKMTVQKIYVDEKVLSHDELDHDKLLEKNLVLMALLCNDAITVKDKEIGDPTEVALVNLGEVYDLDELDIRKDYPRVSEVPFDSDRKLMSTANKLEDKTFMITKGALDVLLLRSISIVTSSGVKTLTEDDKKEIERVNKEFSESGLRVLAFAYKEIENGKTIGTEDENDLIFVGLISMMDPPRIESATAVADCIRSGIKPVMITGDHKITASAIARQIGILTNESVAIEGYEIDSLSDEELKTKVEHISVYARVSPEHKIRIVRAWQERGNIVAMTGDGVNDAPALKQADIGIAMGITGTEVAKDAASIVLMDDNFSTIVKAISNGRSIYSNIKNSIKFLLSGNTAAVISVLYTSLAALPMPFAPVHLLFINLVTDSLPAIAIGLEPHNKNIMNEKPRDINSPILNKSFSIEVLIEGLIIALGTMTAFHIGLSTGDTLASSTMAFATLCFSRLLHGFNSRSQQSIFKIGVFSNKYLWIATILGYLLLEFVLSFKPLMGVFEVAPLTINQRAIVYGLSLMPLILIQTYKLLFVKANK
ncbi:cation-translocating P-type ATPase [Clostridium tagluense]|uniref:cation-translocating P-type ATPase n=1 Tax=Clostridium tagluense TaxID=360422 RepID=UPI001CF1BE8E|nr:cation-translocating P-type ATPase [Clostridium tagluense]MCB2314216.1 cation-translocating P-type ATPase [Clostridium tagluense]MCB2319082.1 cation-translocating P-type ATPase [Clostridium tagluense]MCB2323963.1 cation-translocating P-type ATPase [Clostridium tagluense]MCB2328813.1 cation-translocating P-type ATPase [Clostridium tagluense]MCB2333643.1 cation-translocating P-type ATPase [Clostridium tagluense]